MVAISFVTMATPRTALLSATLLLSSTNAALPWMDPTMPVSARVELLLAQMNITEKLWQLRRPDWDPTLPATGVGLLEFGQIIPGSNNATDVVRKRNSFQRALLSAGPGARLSIPAAFRLFSIHGAEAYGTTFPEGPGLGATWDTSLIATAGQVIAAEGRAIGADMVLPVINMWSDARFGRQEEGFSEDPVLTSALISSFILGAQGSLGLPRNAYLDNTTQQAVLCKHVGGYAAAAGGMNGMRADVPEHTVREYYLKPWRRAAVSGARGVMPAHNTLLNVPCHASPWLLRDRLRSDFNMSQGLFLSDTGDIAALANFRLCSDDASCAALAINAGVDIEQVQGQTYLSLPQAIERNLTTQQTVDDAVRHVLTHKFSARLFDSPYTDESLAASVVNSAAHRAVALQVAQEGTVLLLNKGDALPWAKGGSLRIAVVGPNGGCEGGASTCDATAAMIGNYAEGAYPPTGVQTVAAALSASGYAASVTFNRGCNIDDGNTSLIPAAVSAAQAADVILAVLGDSTSSCGEGLDRDDLDLPGGQLLLLNSLASVGKPLVVVLIHCRAATFGASTGNAALAQVGALLAAWRPGQMGGEAIASLLFGDATPSGKLPMSWVRAVGQANGPASPWLQERASILSGEGYGAEGRVYGGYTHGVNPSTPLFPFGYGLSYTSFSLSSFSLTVDGSNMSVPLQASITVRNTGSAQGAAVVQLYVQDPVGVTLTVRPWKRLLSFARTPILPPGGSYTASMACRADDLALVGDDMVLRVMPGVYKASAGLDSASDAEQVQTFTITQGFVPALTP